MHSSAAVSSVDFARPQLISEELLAEAIVKTVAYVDVFDYPLTLSEVHRYLVGISVSRVAVATLFRNGRLIPHHLSYYQGYCTLPGREAIVATRQTREANARQLWPQALHYGRQITALPFVRMVALTGSLAVSNTPPEADMDYLVVTENGRLWLTRALIVLIVRLAALRGIALCPNYILSQQALTFPDQTLYTAREIVQMVPLSGLDIYQQLRQANAWTSHLLPNAHYHSNAQTQPDSSPSWGRYLSEALFRTALGNSLEQWEMRRKIRKFSRQIDPTTAEASFSADWCKGHFDGHAHRIMDSYTAKLGQLTLTTPGSSVKQLHQEVSP